MRRAGRRTARRSVRRRSRRRRRRRRRRIFLIGGGLLAIGGYKMSKKDKQRVEDHTGHDAEELTDEELAQAMDELGIEKQGLDEQDQAYIDQGASGEAGPVSTDAPVGEPDYLAELERLGHLRDQGIISDEDFEMKKKQLLGL